MKTIEPKLSNSNDLSPGISVAPLGDTVQGLTLEEYLKEGKIEEPKKISEEKKPLIEVEAESSLNRLNSEAIAFNSNKLGNRLNRDRANT